MKKKIKLNDNPKNLKIYFFLSKREKLRRHIEFYNPIQTQEKKC